MIDRRSLTHIDWVLVVVTVTLTSIGIATIYSATHTTAPAIYKKQLYWFFISTALIIPVLIINYNTLKRFAYPILAVAVLMLIATLIFGRTIGGSQRWISLGFINFQPSELAKIAFIIALAARLSEKAPLKGLDIKDLLVPLVLLAVPFLLIAKQPDLGTALIFLFIFATMTFIVKIRLRTLIAFGLPALALIPVAWVYLLKGYQKSRLMSFVDPAMDPLGSGYQTLQSKIAIGSGGVLGKGFTKGTQGNLSFLPEHHTDFVFPVLAEEWGFIGAAIVLGLFLTLILRGISTANSSKDRFGFLLAIGVTSMIFWHIVINISMVMGFMPVVGVPLPFLSYGGSFLLSVTVAVAILININMRRFVL
ncbi:MAG: rod shape-determining protein RodA [Deltaproteobacteria bacterium]|nr:rod shape-determining protein RodA [Deltaproteobacteria bacterium]